MSSNSLLVGIIPCDLGLGCFHFDLSVRRALILALSRCQGAPARLSVREGPGVLSGAWMPWLGTHDFLIESQEVVKAILRLARHRI
jgi:hypothetical protein